MTLVLNRIRKQYGNQMILHDISLTFKPKTIYGLLGRNGAGKSTLLKIISHRINKDSGELRFNQAPLWENQDNMSRIYLMNDDNWFNNNMKMHEIFHFVDDVTGDFDWEFAQNLTRAFALDPNKRFKSLSTGYKTIAKIIIAFCVPSDYVFLDEPALGLDANHRQLFNKKLLEAYDRRPRSFIISTHIIEEIAFLLQEVIIIQDGVIMEETDIESLLSIGHTISGQANLVDEYTAGCNVIAQEDLGPFKQVVVLGDIPNDIPDEITIGPLGLQEYLVHITRKENEV